MYLTYYKSKPKAKPDYSSLDSFLKSQCKKPDGVRKTIQVNTYSSTSCVLSETQWFGTTLETLKAKPKSDWYREFDIPKRNGKMRHIKAPQGEMKRAQAYVMWNLKRVFNLLESDAAYGFVKGRGCKDAMLKHQKAGARWFLKVDFSDFFPSIGADLIRDSLRKIANTSVLTTEELYDILYVLTDETGHLTQGCISSPYIANIVMTEFDYLMIKFCKENGLMYTRYADDIQISSPYKFDWKGVMKYIRTIIPEGLRINDNKTQFRSMNSSNFLLGICYNNYQQLTVGHKKKNQIKVIAHKIAVGDTEGIDIPHWKGLLSYYSMIEPDYFSQERFEVIRNA